ncbi:MAG: hypothetical protein JRD05_12030 [Deltaproteobacteria bacterium]|nr:hypothetical protein [Deltaproteobacteria bacterium]
MAEDNIKRKLRDILCADVKSYNCMMGEDEVGTFHTLLSYLEIILSITLEEEVNAIISTNGAQTGR